MSVSKWRTELADMARSEGAEKVEIELTRGNHLRVRMWRDGRERSITASLTPSDRRVTHRVRQDMRRAWQ